MEILLIVIGLALIVVGIYFAINGFGQAHAGGATGGAKLEGPAWLIVIGIGVGLIVFAAIYDFENTSGDSNPRDTQQPTTDPVATTSPEFPPIQTPSAPESDPGVPTPGPDQSGCTVTIVNPFASISETPEPFGQEITRVPRGTYTVLEITNVSFAGSNQRWLRLSVDGRQGWIEDSTIFIDSKSGCSF